MPRPPIERSVAGEPLVTVFKPAGVPARELEQLQLTVDELESLRLVDLEGLSHEQAAGVMGVSRQTIGRVVERSRAKVAEALVAGKAILIAGGKYRVQPRQWRCFACQTRWVADAEAGHVTECPACGSDDVGLCWGAGEQCGRRRGGGGRGPGRGGTGHGPHGPGCGAPQGKGRQSAVGCGAEQGSVDGGRGGGRGCRGGAGRGRSAGRGRAADTSPAHAAPATSAAPDGTTAGARTQTHTPDRSETRDHE